MSPNTNFSAGSLLATPISSIPGNSTAQGTHTTFILPKIGSLPAGCYESVIADVTEAMQSDQVVGIDCFHELTDASGHAYRVRFRFYEHEVNGLCDTLASYGLAGSLGSVLKGLSEIIDVKPKPGNSMYMHIAGRSLKVMKTPVAVSTVSSGQADAPKESSAMATTKIKKKGGLVERLQRHPRPQSVTRQALDLLADEDEDDEFDDFLEDDDDSSSED